jgi:hypothetical protein
VGELQDALRDSLGKAEFARFFSGLSLASNELELSGGQLEIGQGSEADVTLFSLPYRRSWRPLGPQQPGWQFEGALGYATSRESTPDLYQGQLPGAETSILARWRTVGGLVGFGPELPLGSDWRLAVTGNLSLAHIQSRATYGGPGAAVSAELLDGIAFNWDAWSGSLGNAARLDFERQLLPDLGLECLARYDLRWSRTLAADDPAQEFTSRLQVLTLRSELKGDLSWRAFGQALSWSAHAGWQRFAEGDLFGVKHLYQVGGGLGLPLPLGVPVLRRAVLSGALLFGDDLTGWSFGLSAAL